MKQCKKCGSSNPDENMYCSTCGGLIEISENIHSATVGQTIKDTANKKWAVGVVIICVAIAFITIAICVSVSQGKSSKTTTASTPATTTKAVSTVAPVSTPKPTPKPTPQPTTDTQSKLEALRRQRANVVKENYGYVEYTELTRNPSEYKGKSLSYEGKVIQVMEDYSNEGFNIVTVLVSVGGNYNKLVRATYLMSSEETRILEDDYIHIYGTFNGLYTYKTVRGDGNTIPDIMADLIE